MSRPIAYLGDHVSLTTTTFGDRIYVDTLDTISAPHLLLEGVWEAWIAKFLHSVLKDLPRGSFIDVGAHLGWYTLLAHQLLGEDCTVYAFEPNTRVRELLDRTLHINGLAKRTQLYPYALADADGMAKFEMPRSWSANARIVSDSSMAEARLRPRGDAQRRAHHSDYTSVPMRMLDSVLVVESRIDFIKVDAEGAESRVLRGAERVLKTNPRIQLLVEHHDKGKLLEEEVKTMHWLTTELGFALAVVEHDSRLRQLSLKDLEKLPDSEMLYLTRPR
jgi:FkbM family methyltransferase